MAIERDTANQCQVRRLRVVQRLLQVAVVPTSKARRGEEGSSAGCRPVSSVFGIVPVASHQTLSIAPSPKPGKDVLLWIVDAVCGLVVEISCDGDVVGAEGIAGSWHGLDSEGDVW